MRPRAEPAIDTTPPIVARPGLIALHPAGTVVRSDLRIAHTHTHPPRRRSATAPRPHGTASAVTVAAVVEERPRPHPSHCSDTRSRRLNAIRWRRSRVTAESRASPVQPLRDETTTFGFGLSTGRDGRG